MATSSWLPLAEIRGRHRTHPVRLAEVPIEYEVSFPLPTRRFHKPAFAWFASPCQRRPDAPAEQAPPDRWWVLDAQTGHLIIYTLTLVHPLGGLVGSVPVPVPPRTVSQQRALVQQLEVELDRAVPDFFAGQSHDRQSLRVTLSQVLPAEIIPVYRALVPDFWTWLEA